MHPLSMNRLPMRKSLLAGLITACWASVFPLHAEDTITVNAASLQDAGKLVTATKTLSLTASDGAGLLATLPGFNQIRNGGSNGDPIMRGMFGSRLNILADGGNLQGGCGSRMDAPTSYMSPNSFDLLEVVKGPQTVLWGPMASAGTLLFERSPEHFTQPAIKGDISLLQGSHGRSDQAISLVAGSQTGWLRADANRSQAKDYKAGDGSVVPSLWRKWNAGVMLGWTPTDSDLVELAVNGGDGEARYAGRGMDGAKFLRKSVALKIEKNDVSEYIRKLSWRSYYNSTDHVMDNFSLRQPPMMKMSSQVGSVVYGSRFSMEWEQGNTLLTSGFDAQLNQHRKKQSQGWQADAETRQLGLFTQWQQTLDDESKIVVGGRVDNIQANDLRPTREGRRQSWLPGAFARYEHIFPDTHVMAWSGVGYTERFPDYWELFSGKAGSQSFRRLKTEKTLQWDSGVEYRSESIDYWLSSWVNKVNDYILFDYSTPASQAINVAAWTLGGEAGMGWRFAPNWKLAGSVAYTRGENLSQHRPLPQLPPLDGKVELSYGMDKWDTTLSWRAVAAQTRVAQDQGNVTGRDLGRSPGFSLVSLSANYRFNNHLKLGAGIDNIFNKQYSEHLNGAGNKLFGFSTNQRIPEPGRSGWINIEYKF